MAERVSQLKHVRAQPGDVRRIHDVVESRGILEHGRAVRIPAAVVHALAAEKRAARDENVVERLRIGRSGHHDLASDVADTRRRGVIDRHAAQGTRSAVVDQRRRGIRSIGILKMVNRNFAHADGVAAGRGDVNKIGAGRFAQDVAEDPIHRAASCGGALAVENCSSGESHILHAHDVNGRRRASVAFSVPNGNGQRAIGCGSTGGQGFQAALLHPEIEDVGELQRSVVGLPGGLHAQASVGQREADGVVGPDGLVVAVNRDVFEREAGLPCIQERENGRRAWARAWCDLDVSLRGRRESHQRAIAEAANAQPGAEWQIRRGGRTLRLIHEIPAGGEYDVRDDTRAANRGGARRVDRARDGRGVVGGAVAFRAVGRAGHVHIGTRSGEAAVAADLQRRGRENARIVPRGCERSADRGVPGDGEIAAKAEAERGNIIGRAGGGNVGRENYVRLRDRAANARAGELNQVASRGRVEVIVAEAIGLEWVCRGHGHRGVGVDRRERRTRCAGSRRLAHAHGRAGDRVPRGAKYDVVLARALRAGSRRQRQREQRDNRRGHKRTDSIWAPPAVS